MAKRQALLDAIYVRVMNGGGARQAAAPLRIFCLQEMPLAGARAQDLAPGGNFKPLGRRFLGFNAFWASHKIREPFLRKERAI